MHKYRIQKYTDDFKIQILKIWEKSVLATHEFLETSDFIEIQDEVNRINFNDLQVYCITEKNIVLGFIGLVDNKIEMLFLDPEYFGLGIGLKLLEFAVKDLETVKVDVNEPNIKAINFYKKFGFEVYERTEKDDQGRNYPLLRMKLKEGQKEFIP